MPLQLIIVLQVRGKVQLGTDRNGHRHLAQAQLVQFGMGYICRDGSSHLASVDQGIQCDLPVQQGGMTVKTSPGYSLVE